MGAKLEPVPEHSNDRRTTYRVTFKSLGGATAGGILCMPVAPGKYPVSLDLMGYGADPYWYDPASDPERIQFLVSVRGQGIFKEPEGRWIDRGLDSKEHFYYRGAFCDIVRAIDFVCSLDRADTSRIIAMGDSQGGAFTWIAGSLDHRVRAIAPSVPFLCDYPDYARIVWWPVHEVFEAADAQGIPREELMRTLSYFDVKNFTDRVQCPVFMAFGLLDPTCPPHTNFAAYNQVSAPKEFHCEPLCGHAMWKERRFQQLRSAFFDRN
jgi:cephalosporin-C deacetylase